MNEEDDHFAVDSLSPSACSSLLKHNGSNLLNESATTASSASSYNAHNLVECRRNYLAKNFRKNDINTANSNMSSKNNQSVRRKNNLQNIINSLKRDGSKNSRGKSKAPSCSGDVNSSFHSNTNFNANAISSSNVENSIRSSARSENKSNCQLQQRIGNRSSQTSRSMFRLICSDDAKNDDDYKDMEACDYDNSMYKSDDVSSLHFDEYGYDVPLQSRQIDDSNDQDDDDVSDFFKAPTQWELSAEIFRLLEPNVEVSEALKSIGKIKMWGLVAESDPITAKNFVEYKVVSTLLIFVQFLVKIRRKLKNKHRQHVSEHEQKYGVKCSTIKDYMDGIDDEVLISTHHRDFVDASANIELSLHQAMQVIHYCVCLDDDSRGDNNSKSNSHLAPSVKEAFVMQLVETDGVDILVTLLEELLADQMDRMISTNPSCCDNDPLSTAAANSNITTWDTTIGQYGHSISKSIWGILMSVGTSETAVRVLKRTKKSSLSSTSLTGDGSMAQQLLAGILIGLNHRFYVEKFYRNCDCPNRLEFYRSQCIMPSDFGRSVGNGNKNNNYFTNFSNSSWMEDLFVALCRLVGSKHADDENDDCHTDCSGEDHLGKSNDPSNYGNNNCNENRAPYANKPHRNSHIASTEMPLRRQHDEIRFVVIELCLVKKTLKALVDEPNAVLGRDPFVTTLAMSFFYACLRFGILRYPQLRKQQENEQQRKEGAGKTTNPGKRPRAERMVSRSLDYDRLVHFTVTSLQSFPSHPLIQGNGCLILESIPKPYKLLWMNHPVMNSTKNSNVKHLLCPNSSSDSAAPPADVLCSPSIVYNCHSRTAHGRLPPILKFEPHRKSLASSFVGKVIEPCSWYCPTTAS